MANNEVRFISSGIKLPAFSSSHSLLRSPNNISFNYDPQPINLTSQFVQNQLFLHHSFEKSSLFCSATLGLTDSESGQSESGDDSGTVSQYDSLFCLATLGLTDSESGQSKSGDDSGTVIQHKGDESRPVIQSKNADTGKVDLTMDIVEYKSGGGISGGGGISSGITSGPQVGLIGGIAIYLKNLFGRIQKLTLSLVRGQIDSMFRINYTNPWIEGDDKRTSRAIMVQNSRTPGQLVHGNQPNNSGLTIERITAGIEYSRPLRPKWNGTAGIMGGIPYRTEHTIPYRILYRNFRYAFLHTDTVPKFSVYRVSVYRVSVYRKFGILKTHAAYRTKISVYHTVSKFSVYTIYTDFFVCRFIPKYIPCHIVSYRNYLNKLINYII